MAVKIKIGDTILATVDGGNWDCIDTDVAEILTNMTRRIDAERAGDYEPNHDRSLALTAVALFGGTVLTPPPTFDKETVY